MRSRSKSRSLSFGLSSLLFSLDCGTERTKIEFPLSKTGNPVWLPPEDHRRDDSVLSLLLLFNEDPLEWASGLRGPDWDWDWVALAAAPSSRLSLTTTTTNATTMTTRTRSSGHVTRVTVGHSLARCSSHPLFLSLSVSLPRNRNRVRPIEGMRRMSAKSALVPPFRPSFLPSSLFTVVFFFSQ